MKGVNKEKVEIQSMAEPLSLCILNSYWTAIIEASKSVTFRLSYSHLPTDQCLVYLMFHYSNIYLIFQSSLVFTHFIEVIINSAREKSCGRIAKLFGKLSPLPVEQMIITIDCAPSFISFLVSYYFDYQHLFLHYSLLNLLLYEYYIWV